MKAIDEFINNDQLLDDTYDLLKQVFDIERIIGRISNDKANPQDILNLSKSLSILKDINHLIKSNHRSLKQIINKQKDLKKIIQLINKTIVDEPPINFNKGYFINNGINKSLDEYRNISKDANKWLVEYQEKQKTKTNIPSLKISYNKVFGYYIDITKTHLDKVPDYFIRKQTLTNSERYFTAELKEYEEKILFSNDKSLEIEKEIFHSLKSKIILQFKNIQFNAKIIAQIDVAVSHAHTAVK